MLQASAATMTDDAVCDPWLGPGVELTVCNPDVVRRALERGGVGDTANLHVSGADGRSATAPGLVQVMGQGAGHGQELNLQGSALRGARLTARTQLRSQTVTQTFGIPPDLDGARLELHQTSRSEATIRVGERILRPIERKVLRTAP